MTLLALLRIPRARRISVRLATTVWMLACLLSIGCTSLRLPNQPFSGGDAAQGNYSGLEGIEPLAESESQQVYQSVRQAKTQNALVLHVPGDDPPVRILPLPAEGRSVYVSNLLRETGVQKKMGSIEVTLFRHSSASFTGIPMDCKMTRDGQSVRPESDYALQSGDRLRVQKVASSTAQELLNMVLGL